MSLRTSPFLTVYTCAALLAALTPGCSEGDGDGTASTPPGAGGAGVSDSPCEAHCDREVAAMCPKTPDSYANVCKFACADTRKGLSEACGAVFDEQYRCAATKFTYACSSLGDVEELPEGACATEAQACKQCAGKLCIPSLLERRQPPATSPIKSQSEQSNQS